MIKVKFANKFDKIRWDEYVYNSKNSTFFHLYDWSTVVENSYSHQSIYLYAESSNKIIGILPLFFLRNRILGSCMISLPFCDYGGPLSDNKEIDNILIKKSINISIEKKVNYFQIRSINNYRIENMVNNTDKVNLILNLKSDYTKLWSALKPKVRNQVRKSEKNLKIILPTKLEKEKSLAQFYKVFSQNMRDLGTPVHSVRFFKSMVEIFSDQINFAHILLDNKTIASAIYINFKDSIEVPFASSIKKYRSLCPNNLLYWELIKLACIQNKSQFIFGRSTRGSGTFNFKKQWGAISERLNYQFISLDNKSQPIQSSHKRTYAFSRKIWSKLPLPIANIMGPLIMRNIP